MVNSIAPMGFEKLLRLPEPHSKFFFEKFGVLKKNMLDGAGRLPETFVSALVWLSLHPENMMTSAWLDLVWAVISWAWPSFPKAVKVEKACEVEKSKLP